MPELRHDALTGRLVLLAPGRAARPHTTVSASAKASDAGCPFCPGHEGETPPEVARVGPGAPDTPGWRVRVVPNLYPIVGGTDPGMGATGAHEVVVLSPDHDRDFGALSDEQAADVVTTLRDRTRFHAGAGRAHVQVLVNQGRAAGASIAHPHAQVVALDFVPPAVTVAVERFHDAPDDLVLADRTDAAAIGNDVVPGAEVQAWCPRGSAAPFEVRLATAGGGSRFADATDGEVLGLALVLRDLLARLRAVLGDTPYNVVVHDGPTDAVRYHWWVEVVPRTSVVAGFELGTGVLVNTVDPAVAAAQLRGEAPG